jgi:hypothetical protein
MGPLVRVSLAVRALARHGYGLFACAGLAAYLVAGGATGELGAPKYVAAGIWAVLVGARIARKLRETGDAPLLLDIEIGALLAVALQGALVRYDGGLDGRFAPAIYVLVALVAAFARPFAGIVVVAWTIGLEAALRFLTLDQLDTGSFATHATFVGAFAVLNLALLRAEEVRGPLEDLRTLPPAGEVGPAARGDSKAGAGGCGSRPCEGRR